MCRKRKQINIRVCNSCSCSNSSSSSISCPAAYLPLFEKRKNIIIAAFAEKMLQDTNSTAIQPKVVVIRRRPNQGFGFTLRHFIAYPPEDDPSWPQVSFKVHTYAAQK